MNLSAGAEELEALPPGAGTRGEGVLCWPHCERNGWHGDVVDCFGAVVAEWTVALVPERWVDECVVVNHVSKLRGELQKMAHRTDRWLGSLMV